MKQHKWHKEIKAWADGAEIEFRFLDDDLTWRYAGTFPAWNNDRYEYRIKPQPKEPQYLYVYQTGGKMEFARVKRDTLNFVCGDREYPFNYVGKIKLETEDE